MSRPQPFVANQLETSSPRDARVIMLDDCPSMGRRYGQALRDRGLLVKHYSRPKEFLRAAQDQQLGKVDLFLIDVTFSNGCWFPAGETLQGELEGLRVAQWLQRESNYRGVPVVLASASPFEDVLSSAKNVALSLNTEESCNCIFVHKLHYCPDKLAELVADYFATGSFFLSGEGPLSWFKSLFFM